MRTNNQFKNIRKSLRNNNSVSVLPLSKDKENKTKPINCYECLDNNYCEVNDSNDSNEPNVLTKNSFNLNYLPEDTINIILEYLPFYTRIKILKIKYHEKNLQLKLQNIPKTNLNKLFEYAKTSQEVLDFVLNKESFVFTNLSTYALNSFKKEKELDKYSDYYKKNFTAIILAAMKHYTKIYKKPQTDTKLLYGNTKQYNNNKIVIEEIIFRLYAQVILI
jgi:hypothetical protein